MSKFKVSGNLAPGEDLIDRRQLPGVLTEQRPISLSSSSYGAINPIMTVLPS